MQIKPLQMLATAVLLSAAGLGTAAAQQAARPPQLKLTVPAFRDGGQIPTEYTCAAKADMKSPMLEWTNVPKGTASFTLLLHDIDAHPRKGITDVTHWIVWDIPGTATKLGEGIPVKPRLPDGAIQGKNIRGVNGYQGPCAPPGKPHHYLFELYALDQKLSVGPEASRADVLNAMDGHIIGKSAYFGMFHQ